MSLANGTGLGITLLTLAPVSAVTAASGLLSPTINYIPTVLAPASPALGWSLPNAMAATFSAFWSGYVLAEYQKSVLWLQRISKTTPGAVSTQTFDAVARRYPTTFTDGSYGVGWAAPYPPTGTLYKGYFPPQVVEVAINDRATTQKMLDSGLVTYTSPRLYWQPPVAMHKGDLIIRANGTRCVVADEIIPAQVMGVTIVYSAELETRTSVDPVYLVPLI
jgi:hypothetical protein